MNSYNDFKIKTDDLLNSLKQKWSIDNANELRDQLHSDFSIRWLSELDSIFIFNLLINEKSAKIQGKYGVDYDKLFTIYETILNNHLEITSTNIIWYIIDQYNIWKSKGTINLNDGIAEKLINLFENKHKKKWIYKLFIST